MPNKNNNNPTNAAEVKRQNQQSAQQGTGTTQGNYRTEFASETDVNEVIQRNQQSAQKKNMASGAQANRNNNTTK